MKVQEVILLLASGLLIWIAGTIYYEFRGPTVLETTSLRYWITFTASPLFSALLCCHPMVAPDPSRELDICDAPACDSGNAR